MRIFTTIFALAALLATGVAGAAVRVVDDAGNPVSLAQPARRIVSLAPHATELLFAAGAGSTVVGVAAHSDWPLQARALPRVGDAGTLDVERIAALAPDLVVAWPHTAPAQLATLKALKIPVFVSHPRSIGDIADNLEKLGTLAGTRGVSAAAAAGMRERQAELASRYRDAERLRVFYQVWNEPLYTIGGRHLITEAIATCGGDNVFADLSLPAPSVSIEAVIAAAPEVIVGGDDAGRRPAWLADWLQWPALPAVRDGNLFVADGNLLHRPGPRFLDGVAALCADFERARARRKGPAKRHGAYNSVPKAHTAAAMNKAFTRESDDDVDDDAPESAPLLPAGTKNYMTPGGFGRLKAELDRLVGTERPELVATIAWAAGNGDRSENGDYIYGKKRLREVDRRIRFLVKRLDKAEVVDPAVRDEDEDRVYFGATVDIVNGKGDKRTVSIVGVDEIDTARGYISWVSPMARALIRAREGDSVTLQTPGGLEELAIAAVRYVPLATENAA